MFHYVYRITNIKLKKHYYGARSSKDPSSDLGIKYFSSSTDKEFIQDQKENLQNYKYKIIKIFNTRKESINLEIKLHNKYNVGVNESFYNKAKQTSVGFDRSGKTMSHTNVSKEKISEGNKGKKRSKKQKRHLSEIRKERFASGKIIKPIGEKNGMYGKKFSEEWKFKQSERLKGHKKKTTKNYSKPGSKNGNAKLIEIYNNKDELIFTTNGNFKQICMNNNLPYAPLCRSYSNNGAKLFSSNASIAQAKNSGMIKYQGWYAIFKSI